MNEPTLFDQPKRTFAFCEKCGGYCIPSAEIQPDGAILCEVCQELETSNGETR